MSNVNELMKQLEETKKQIEVLEKQLEEAKKESDKRTYFSENETLNETLGDKYYFINGYSILSGDISLRLKERIENCTAFRTVEGAERVMRQQELMRKLQRFSEENGGLYIDWNNYEQYKYAIDYNYIDNVLDVDCCVYYRSINTVYFISEEVCKLAIEKFKDELLEYFKL